MDLFSDSALMLNSNNCPTDSVADIERISSTSSPKGVLISIKRGSLGMVVSRPMVYLFKDVVR